MRISDIIINNNRIKLGFIEVALKISNTWSWQAWKCMKGNHRRMLYKGISIMWGQGEHP